MKLKLCAYANDNLSWYYSEVFDIASAAFVVIRGQPHPMDLCSIHNKKYRMFACLSVTWGIISDIDIESERFRLLGNARFTAGAVYRILALRIYGGKVSYLPCLEKKTEPAAGKDGLPVAINYNQNWTTVLSTTPGVFEAITENDEAPANRGGVDASLGEETGNGSGKVSGDKVRLQQRTGENVVEQTGQQSTGENVEQNIHQRTGDNVGQTGQQSTGENVEENNRQSTKHVEQNNQSVRKRHKSLAVFKKDRKYQSFEDSADSNAEEQTVNNHGRNRRAFSTTELRDASTAQSPSGVTLKQPTRPVNGPNDTLLPSLDSEVPEDWVTVDGEFVTVIVMVISHLGSNLITCPDLEMADGNMELMFVKKGITRKSLIDVLTKMETGEHVKNKDLVIRRVQAFRLEPGFERTGYLAVDGEAIDYGAIQGQVHQGMGRVFLCP